MKKKFVLIFGPPAAGKMTVGRKLEEMTDLKLFHNHMTIELLLPFFEYGSEPFSKLNRKFRIEFIEEMAKSDYEGIIFTHTWALDKESEKANIENYSKAFKEIDADFFYVELDASQETRLTRNSGEDRLREKASKRDVEASNSRLIENDQKHVFNSSPDFPFFFKPHLKIDNNHRSAQEAAQVAKKFIYGD